MIAKQMEAINQNMISTIQEVLTNHPGMPQSTFLYSPQQTISSGHQINLISQTTPIQLNTNEAKTSNENNIRNSQEKESELTKLI